MFIHITVLLFVCIVGMYFYWTPCRKKKNANIYFVSICMLPIWIIQTIRAETVGIDTPSYVRSFSVINQKGLSWEELNWEKGYVLLNRLVWFLFGNNYHFLLGMVSFIILLGIGYFILNNTQNSETFWAMFLFVTLNHYLTSMVSLRQYCAIAIGINAFTILDKKKCFKNYIFASLICILALMFHNSAIVFVCVLLPSFFKRVNKKIFLSIVGISVLVFCSIDKIIQIMGLILPSYRVYQYGAHELSAGVQFANSYIILLMGKVLLIVLVFCLNEKEAKSIYNLSLYMLVGIFCSLLTTKMAVFFRLTYYFDIYLIIYIPKVLGKLSGIKIRRGFFALVFILAIVYYIYTLYTNCSKCVPYVI